MPWMIKCEVWGGVTGYRTAPLKKNGVEVVYPTEEAADQEAAALRNEANRNPYRVANFWYEPVKV